MNNENSFFKLKNIDIIEALFDTIDVIEKINNEDISESVKKARIAQAVLRRHRYYDPEKKETEEYQKFNINEMLFYLEVSNNGNISVGKGRVDEIILKSTDEGVMKKYILIDDDAINPARIEKKESDLHWSRDDFLEKINDAFDELES